MHEISILLTLGPMASAATLFVIFFLPLFRLTRPPVAPEELVAPLARRLRALGYAATEAPGRISVRLGSVASVRVELRDVAEGTEVRWRPDATPTGWTVILILLFLGSYGFTALASLVLILYVYFRASRFALEVLAPEAGAVRAPRGPPDAGSLLLDGLAEAHRLAEDAYLAVASTYWDTQLLGLLGAVLAWAAMFFALLTANVPVAPTLALATTGAAFVEITDALLAWRRFRGRLEPPRRWANRLREAWRREADRPSPPADRGSVLALLREASGQVPAWLALSQRAGFLRDPHANVVSVLLGFGGFWTLWAAVWLLPDTYDLPVSEILAVAGSLLLAASAILHRRWARAQDEAAARSLDEWTRRFLTMQTKVERSLTRP